MTFRKQIDAAILVCAIAASTPRRPTHCVYTGAIATALRLVDRSTREGRRFVKAVIDHASWARDKAAGTGWVNRRTQESDAHAEQILRVLYGRTQ